ncbi:MAG: hypothetical protein IKQ82_06995 [Lentisphaeria bacterium]|nr:hypothetical protein [Lentisphaeria bacterium]
MNWFSELGILRDWPPLALPFAVAIVGELVLAGLMIRSREDRKHLLLSAVLLPLHVLMYLMVFHPPWEFFIEIYVFSAPVLALGLIVYLCILCRRKRMNRRLWTAAAVWVLYFASVVFLVVFTVLMAQAFRR